VLQAEEVFLLPALVVADLYGIDPLQAPASLPDGHGEPEFPLVVLETIPVHPASAQRKLHIVEEHKLVCDQSLEKQAAPGHEVGLMASDDHGDLRWAVRMHMRWSPGRLKMAKIKGQRNVKWVSTVGIPALFGGCNRESKNTVSRKQASAQVV
jgi:hypothetical protein